jgi:hypothetical protein
MTERIIKGANGRKYITTEPLLNQGPDYERGFVDGMQKQSQSSVDKAVNAMAQPAVPDAFGTREGEHPQYVQGWNDCRALMLEMMKARKP